MRLAVSLKTMLIWIAVLAVSFLISLKAMDWIAPRGGGPAPVLVELPPLSPVSKRSFVLAPVAIALTAIPISIVLRLTASRIVPPGLIQGGVYRAGLCGARVAARG